MIKSVSTLPSPQMVPSNTRSPASCCCNSISWALSMLCMKCVLLLHPSQLSAADLTSSSCQDDAADDSDGLDAGGYTSLYCTYNPLDNLSQSRGWCIPALSRKLLGQGGQPIVSLFSIVLRHPLSPLRRLPTNVQSAVCNEEIKIDRNLYSLFWGNGAWWVLVQLNRTQFIYRCFRAGISRCLPHLWLGLG